MLQRSTLPLPLAVLAVVTAPALAQDGGVLSFDAQDDCVTVPYDVSFPTEVFTASAWIKTPPPAMGNGAIIGRGEDDDSFNFAWQLYMNGAGNLQLTLENESEVNFCYPLSCMGGAPVPTCVAGDMFVADDTWHHVAATRNAGGTLCLYIDGIEVATCTNTGTPSAQNFQSLTIGCTHFFIGFPPGGVEPTAWFFPGLIDEAGVWSIALTATEIMDVLVSGIDPAAPGLIGYWDFNEGTGQVVADASSVGNHGFRGEQPDPDGADPTWVVLIEPCPIDLDDSGAVDFGDLLALLSNWGPCPRECPEDLDGSGAVGFADLLLILAAWGPCA